MWGDSEFDLAGLQAMQRQLEGVAAQFAAGASAADAEFAGSDSAGAVEVLVNGEGHPVKVRLAADWAQVVQPRELGSAIVSAIQAASQERLAAWAKAVAETAEGGDTPVVADDERPADKAGAFRVGDPSSPQSLHAMRDVFDLLDGALEDLAQLQTRASQSATQSDTATNSNHTVRVSTSAGTVTSIEFDEDWVRFSTRDRIVDAVEQALRNSVHRTAERKREWEGSTPSLTRMRQLSSSPETLLRHVGLIQ